MSPVPATVAVAAPAGAPPGVVPAAVAAVQRSAELVAEASREPDGAMRFALARLAGLTTAWAACAGSVYDAARAGSAGPWALLATVRPELAAWAATFAASDRRWSALCRGDSAGAVPADRAATDQAADALLQAAEAFRAVVFPAPATPGQPRGTATTAA